MRTSIVSFFLIHKTVARKLFPPLLENAKPTKRCCWGKCNSDSRYPDRMGKFFIRFPKPGKLRDNMSLWEKNQAKNKTEKAKRWQFLPVWAQGFSKARTYLEIYIYLFFAF